MPRPRTYDDRTGRVFPDHLISEVAVRVGWFRDFARRENILRDRAQRRRHVLTPDMEWNGNIEDDKLHREVVGPGSGTDKLRQLLRTASPAAIDSCDPAGYTILMAAIKGGKSDRAVMLIDNGADIMPVNASGWWRLGPSNTAGRDPTLV